MNFSSIIQSELPQLGVAEVLASCFIVKRFPEGKSYINSTKASSLPEYPKDNAFIYFPMPIHPQPNQNSGCGLLGNEVKIKTKNSQPRKTMNSELLVFGIFGMLFFGFFCFIVFSGQYFCGEDYHQLCGTKPEWNFFYMFMFIVFAIVSIIGAFIGGET